MIFGLTRKFKVITSIFLFFLSYLCFNFSPFALNYPFPSSNVRMHPPPLVPTGIRWHKNKYPPESWKVQSDNNVAPHFWQPLRPTTELPDMQLFSATHLLWLRITVPPDSSIYLRLSPRWRWLLPILAYLILTPFTSYKILIPAPPHLSKLHPPLHTY